MNMKRFLMALAGVLSMTAANGQEVKTVTPKNCEGASILENIMTRTSVRRYTDQAVSAETVETLLRAGMAAPTAVNRQPWHFIVVTDKEKLAGLAEANPNAGMVRRAPLAIVVCGDMSKALDGPLQAYWVQDCSAATENILLAAYAMGLGAVWTGTYPNNAREESVRRVLGLPESIVPLNTLVIGYPAEQPKPKDKWRPENVSYNVYGGQK